jgi:hypothetical protein
MLTYLLDEGGFSGRFVPVAVVDVDRDDATDPNRA